LNYDSDGDEHEVVKEAVMGRHFTPQPASRFCVVWLRLAQPTVKVAGFGVRLRGMRKHSVAVAGLHSLRGSGRASVIAAEPEHTKYSTRYSGRNCGDPIAQV